MEDFVLNPEEYSKIRKLRCRWEYNTKMAFKLVWKDAEYIDLAQVRNVLAP